MLRTIVVVTGWLALVGSARADVQTKKIAYKAAETRSVDRLSHVRRYDVVPQVFQDVMVEGLFGATAYKVYGQKMVDQSFDQVGSPITVGLKDANLIAAAANIARVPMPSHNVYIDRLLGAVAHGDADRDQAVLGREQARASGLE